MSIFLYYTNYTKITKMLDKFYKNIYNFKCVEKYGEIAQLARATGSYPVGRWFEPTSRYQE